MHKVVLYKEVTVSSTEFTARLDRYLSTASDALKVFDYEVECGWNLHRDRLMLRSSMFTADVVHLLNKGVLVIVNLPLIAYPFKRQIEARINHALGEIFADKGSDTC